MSAGGHARLQRLRLAAAALLSDDVERRACGVGEILGSLACATEADGRLRETLRIVMQAHSSYNAAAAELNLHFKFGEISRATCRRTSWPTDRR